MIMRVRDPRRTIVSWKTRIRTVLLSMVMFTGLAVGITAPMASAACTTPSTIPGAQSSCAQPTWHRICPKKKKGKKAKPCYWRYY